MKVAINSIGYNKRYGLRREHVWTFQLSSSFLYITKECNIKENNNKITTTKRAGGSVGIANAFGLDGPGIESRWGRDFPHLSRQALRSTQPPVQWAPGNSQE